jgi:ankyrin repeat protein
MLAASSGDSEIVGALLSNGAEVTGKFTANGKTPLMLAKENHYTEIVKLLQAAGAAE